MDKLVNLSEVRSLLLFTVPHIGHVNTHLYKQVKYKIFHKEY